VDEERQSREAQTGRVESETQDDLREIRARLNAVLAEQAKMLDVSERSRKALLSLLEDQKRTDSALRESEARFRSLTELSSDWYWEQDHEFRAVRYTDTARNRPSDASRPEFGVRRWEVPALNLSEADWATHRALLERHETFRDFEIERANPQGGTTWISISGEAIFDAAGNFVGYRGVGRDITARKRAEAERDRLAAIVEGSGDAIVSRDAGRRIITWNAAAERLFGYTADEVFGRDIDFFVPPERINEVGETRALVEQGIGAKAFDTVRLSKDGRRVHVSLTPSPIHDAAGRIVAVSLIMRDITERKRAEAELARLAAIVEGTGDAIVSRDIDGKILTWNRAAERIFGYKESEIIGRDIDVLNPEELRGQTKHRRALVEQGVVHTAFDAERVAKNGRRLDVSISLSPVRDASGKVVAVSLIMRDITERKRTEQALARQKDLYSALSLTNQVIIRGANREELFQAVCRIAVEQGHFLFAWIGLLDERRERLQPVARHGADEGYLDALFAAIADPSIPKRGLTWRAIDGCAHTLANDFLSHPDTAPWHEAARARGVHSFAAFPIRESGEVAGVFNVYADTPGFFDDDLLGTLDEMTADVSYALDSLQNEARSRQVVDALAESEQRFRVLVEQSMTGIYIIQDGRFTYVNPRMVDIFGYESADELVGRDPLSTVAEMDRERVAQSMRERIEGEVARVGYEFSVRRKDGSLTEVGVFSTRANYRRRPAILGMIQDISEKKRSEAQVKSYMVQLETALMSTVTVATTLGEMRDPYTAGHARRVGEVAAAIGAELGFDAKFQEGLRVAGYLHDIGKISVPTEILAKPGRLDALEFELIKEHAQSSYDILKDVAFPWPVAQIAWQHHERLDGNGYPRGLKGDDILLESRIMAVADVVEAMSSSRPYRPGLGIDKALNEIRRGGGTAYDPNVAEACLRLFQKGYTIPV